MRKNLIILLFFMTSIFHANAATIRCDVEAATYKTGSTFNLASENYIQSSQQHLIVEEDESATLKRCSFQPSARKITCDRYKVSHIEVDRNVNVKKFYLLRAQFDLQIFNDLSFIENNGRGGIAYGTCKFVP